MFEGLIYRVRSLWKKPFKIGLITYTYPYKSKANTGVAVHVYYLSRKLTEFGNEVHVFCRGEKNSIKKEYIGEGKLVVHRIDNRTGWDIEDPMVENRMAHFIFDNKVINEITKENSKTKFNIMHTHGWLTAGTFISKFFNNIKWIHTFHALEKNRLKFMGKDEKRFYKIAKWVESTINYADALIAVSHKLEAEILQNYPVKKEKLHYIPNGVDLNVFKAENATTNEKKVLYVGRFSLEKGIDLVPKIAELVLAKNKEAKFIIIASGEISPSVEKFKAKFEELEQVYKNRFVLKREPVEREDLAELYNECSILMIPSRYESFGLVALEAMACGDAVIASNKGGLPEVVEDAGIVLPLNSKMFAREILNLLDDFRLRERYGRRGIRRARRFSWQFVAKKILDLYKEVIGKAKKEKLKSGAYFKA